MAMTSAFRRFLLIIGCVASFFFVFTANAQRIVVSEYYNTSTPTTEWTELLVIQDNTNLVGYVVRDNGASGTWQGGVRFRDVALWRNVRAGTIIVLRHRGTTANDVSGQDGFIDIGAENDVYFEKYLAPSASFSWDDAALNLSAGNDMIQILDEGGNHVHVLSHGNQSTPSYTSLPLPKINHSNSLGSTSSLRIYPGKTISDYSEPNAGNVKTSDNNANYTLGTPNKNTIGEDENQSYWRELRQPIWNAPSLSITSLTASNIALQWSSATDPWQSDGVQGYLLLRTSEQLADTNQTPQDGKSYAPNDKLGAWIVIGNITGAQTAFDDAVTIPCGETYKYRVYAFRFKQDDLENAAVSANPRLGRGRSYNEISFGQIRATRIFPAVPSISALDNTIFCKGGKSTLSANALPSGIQIQWQKDNNDISGQNGQTLIVSASGRYRIKVTNDQGCTAQSNEIEIIANDPPIAAILPSLPAKLCAGDSLLLTASDGTKYQWLKDNTDLAGETKQTYKAIGPGKYRVIVYDGNSCFDTSSAVAVEQRFVLFTAAKDSLDFGRLDDCTAGKIDSLYISNTGLDTIRIENVQIGGGFSWITPSSPILIPPGKKAYLAFRFTPPGSGTFIAPIDVIAKPCSVALRLYAKGEKDKATITSSLQAINFGTKLSCLSNLKDTIITIHNKSLLPLKIQGQIVSSPYSIASQLFPVIISAQDSLRLTLRYDPTIDGVFASVLQLPFMSGSCFDTLRIDLQGIRTTPKLASNISTLVFSPLLGCENQRDTTIIVRNTGIVSDTISTQPTNANFRFINIPLIINPGEEKQLVIRFAPAAEGNYSIILPVAINPCNRTGFEIQISGSKQGTTFSLSADTLDFGEIVSCSGMASSSRKIRIHISGPSAGAMLTSALIAPPFSAVFNSAISIQDNDSLEFNFAPTSDGEYLGSTSLTFDPCGIKKTIVLRGKRTSIATTFSSNELDFGNVEIGNTQIQQFTLRNSGTAHITVQANSIVPPFRLVSSSPPLPADLSRDSSVVLTLEYMPASVQYDSISVGISVLQPCIQTQQLTLKGNGIFTSPPGDSTIITGVLKVVGGAANLGKTVIFPIILTSDSLNFAQISSLSFDLSFNGSMLMPRSITAGSNLSAGFNPQFTENKPGLLSINIENPSFSTILKSGEIALLHCEALLGNAVSTPLIASSPQAIQSGNKIKIIIAQPDSFTVTGICPPKDRIISLNRPTALAIKTNNGMLEVTADIQTNDFTTLQLYDILGRKQAELLSGELSIGKHTINIERKLLRNNAYFLVLRSGVINHTLPIIIAE